MLVSLCCCSCRGKTLFSGGSDHLKRLKRNVYAFGLFAEKFACNGRLECLQHGTPYGAESSSAQVLLVRSQRLRLFVRHCEKCRMHTYGAMHAS
jgi:hypothetical protein